MSFKQIAVAISGSGRSLANLLARQAGLRFKIVGVISSSSDCAGNDVARRASLPLQILNFGPSGTPDIQSKLRESLDLWHADGIVLAGFLKFWPLVPGWDHAVVNIHPALLPKFGGKGMHGLNVHKAVISQGEAVSGATVHRVDDIYDHGAVISQVEVSVRSGDTAESLAKRVFEAECDLLPRTLDLLAAGELPLRDAKIWRYEFESYGKL